MIVRIRATRARCGGVHTRFKNQNGQSLAFPRTFSEITGRSRVVSKCCTETQKRRGCYSGKLLSVGEVGFSVKKELIDVGNKVVRQGN